jgi:crotonobetainyl-CoA:carnitine CoA-transferase CaiB-like acyl-CoA transferase
VDIPDGAGGTVRTLGCPIKTPGLPERPVGPAPELDQHADEVFQQWLGLSPDEARAEFQARQERP